MAVMAPGRRPRGGLRYGFSLPRGRLPSLLPFGGVRRRVAAGLSMTSMIDVMVVCVVFLLLTFSSSGECACRRDLSKIPAQVNVTEMIDAPLIFVTADAILVDGVPTERGDALRERPGRLDQTFSVLRAKHDLAKQLAPDRERTHVVLAIEGDVPAGVVKSVTRTAALSGYPDIDFMVNVAPR